VGKTWKVRRQAHEKKKKVDALMKETRTELKEFSDAARAFAAEFHPKWLLQREESSDDDGSGGARSPKYKFTPKNYAQHLRNAPKKGGDVVMLFRARAVSGRRAS
jgi:hypothetical protein